MSIGKSNPTLSIVVPVFHEQENIAEFISEIKRNVNCKFEMILVSDSMNDPTFLAARKFLNSQEAELILISQEPGRGPASAIRFGISHARANYVVLMQGDNSDDPKDVNRMVSLLDSGAHLVIASRFNSLGFYRGSSKIKYFLSKLASKSLCLLLRSGITDYSNTYKGFRKSLVLSGIKSNKGFTIGMELVYLAMRRGVPVVEIPTHWEDRKKGNSHFYVLRWLPNYLYWYIQILLPPTWKALGK